MLQLTCVGREREGERGAYMLIGVPKEIKVREYRVGLTPESARELVNNGHEVWVETKAGAGSAPW